ncbi:mechanosensitive ion channel domain-containing protein [Escherichia coli]
MTKINTRATTISDWDRKEIIVPNKAFITEQFINWSLSDSVTRVVLTIPAPADANSEEVTEILLTAARRCSLVIDNPAPGSLPGGSATGDSDFRAAYLRR